MADSEAQEDMKVVNFDLSDIGDKKRFTLPVYTHPKSVIDILEADETEENTYLIQVNYIHVQENNRKTWSAEYDRGDATFPIDVTIDPETLYTSILTGKHIYMYTIDRKTGQGTIFKTKPTNPDRNLRQEAAQTGPSSGPGSEPTSEQ